MAPLLRHDDSHLCHARVPIFGLLALFLSVDASAQTAAQIHPTTRRGMHSGVPLGVVLDRAVNPAHPAGILIRNPGATPPAPTPWTTARFGTVKNDFPNYSFESLFGAQASLVKLASMSTGNDVMPPVNGDGSFLFQQSTPWFALTVSVRNSALGTPGSHASRLVSASDKPGAELFTYYFFGSSGITDHFIHTTTSEQSREMIGFPMNPNPALREDVTAFDYGVGQIAFDRMNRFADLFPIRDKFYFTLEASCVAALGNSFVQLAGNTTGPANASTIYVSNWVLTGGTYTWSKPTIYRNPSELALNNNEEVDALAVDHLHGRVIYSVRNTGLERQLLITQAVPAVTPKPLMANGVPVTTHLGLKDGAGQVHGDDIDGACGIDPEAGVDFSEGLGYPVASYPAAIDPKPLGLSVVRAEVIPQSGSGNGSAPVDPQNPVDTLYLVVSGTDIGANVLGVANFYVADIGGGIGPQPQAPGSAWASIGSAMVQPGQIEAALTFPLGPLDPPAALGLVAELWVVNASGNIQRKGVSVIVHFEDVD